MSPSADSADRRPSRVARTRDPDFDPPLPPPRPLPQDDDPRAYQRLLVNPFLAFLSMIIWAALTRAAVLDRLLSLFLFAQAFLVSSFFLAQFHCLDCGATGRLSRWKGHHCERVADRLLAGRPRRFRGPAPRTQMFLWVYAVMAAAWFAFVLR